MLWAEGYLYHRFLHFIIARVIKNKCWIVLEGSNNDKSLAIVSVVEITMLLIDPYLHKKWK